ncbi:MAG: SDR family NAD(P)-dependent oxidoreductase [Devosia sp.]
MAFFPTYSASKAAMRSLTQAARVLLQAQGTAVFGVYAGPIDTGMTRHLAMPKTSPHEVARAILDGMEVGQEDIFPDAFGASFGRQYEASPKAAERQTPRWLREPPANHTVASRTSIYKFKNWKHDERPQLYDDHTVDQTRKKPALPSMTSAAGGTENSTAARPRLAMSLPIAIRTNRARARVGALVGTCPPLGRGHHAAEIHVIWADRLKTRFGAKHLWQEILRHCG